MFELNEIMRQRESRVFAEILKSLREDNHTDHEILKTKEKIVSDDNSLINVPNLFTQNNKVNDFSERVP